LLRLLSVLDDGNNEVYPLCTSMTRIAMLAELYTPVRASQARQVEG